MAGTSPAGPSAVRQRPLSPHLSIYRFQIPAITSITHRITGGGLTVALLALTAWLWSAAYSPECFATLQTWAQAWWGQAFLFLVTLGFYYHLCNGIRHLGWDVGKGFAIQTAIKTGWLAIISALLLTGVTWFFILT